MHSFKPMAKIAIIGLAAILTINTFISSPFKTVNNIKADTVGEKQLSYARGAMVDGEGNWTFYGKNGKTYDTEYDRMMNEEGFIYGMDWDWFGSFQEGEACLGDDQITGYPSAYREAYVKRGIYNLKAMGYNAVSVWIGPHGAYDYDERGLVTGLDETFEKNLRSILNSFRELELDFVPALQTHGFSIDYNRNGSEGGKQYFKYYRYYYEDEAREAMITNGVDRINAILSEYQDVIPWVALTIENGSGTNDVQNGMLYTSTFATDWEDFAKFQNALHDSVKRAMPEMRTSCEDIGWEDNQFKYNDLKVDIIARQQYQPNAQLQDIDICYTNRPCYVGEFNSSEIRDIYENLSDEYYTSLMPKFFPNLIKQGYIGAFQFQYNTSFKQWSHFYDNASIDNYEKLKNYVIPTVYSITDCKNEFLGIENAVDKPILLYNNGSNTVYWIGGRDMESFTLERSENGGEFVTIAEGINLYDNMLTNGLVYYTDNTAQFGKEYRYRVKAISINGEVSMSEPGNSAERFNPPGLFADSDGNYAGGFEQGGLTGDRSKPNSNGWYNIGWQKIGNFTTADSRSGNYSLLIDTTNPEISRNEDYSAQWGYNLELQPKTTYCFSYYYKSTGGYFSMSVHDIATESTLSWSSPGSNNEENEGQWLYTEATFTTGEDGRVFIKLMNMKNEENMVLYLDDLSIKEDR